MKTGRIVAKWGSTGMGWSACPYKDAVIIASKESLKSLTVLEELGRAFLAEDQMVIWWTTPASATILRNCPAGREQRKKLNLDDSVDDWKGCF